MAAAVSKPPRLSLQLFAAWVPMLPGDDETAAEASADALRAEPEHYWDGQRHLAFQMGAALGISSAESVTAPGGSGFAWDVYLAYPAGAVELLRPVFWMHQLGVKHAPRLDARVFRRQVERMR